MKLKLFLALVALAGLASALALASPTQAGDGKHGSTTATGTSTGTTTGTTTGKKDDDGHHGNSSCQRVELRGTNASGSVALMVTKANSKGSTLVGKQVTLTVPANSTVGATACVDAGGALTLRSLVVKPPAPAPTTSTATTTTTSTTKTPHSHHSHHNSHH